MYVYPLKGRILLPENVNVTYIVSFETKMIDG